MSKSSNRFAVSADFPRKAAILALQDNLQGATDMGMPESVPARACQRLDWGASWSRPFRSGQAELRTIRNEHEKTNRNLP